MTTLQPTTERTPPGRLALADGAVFAGVAFGATGRGVCVAAEVVFNTAMSGYQESLSDPSYSGQILVQTAPLIGNTGVNAEDEESGAVHVAGLVVHELTRRHSNYRATGSLHEHLSRAGVLGVAGVDTRALTRRIRARGTVSGVISDDPGLSDAELVARARRAASMEGANLVPNVGCSAPSTWDEPLGRWRPATGARREPDRRPSVAVLDCGAKRNILRHLTDRGCRLRILPHSTDAATMRSMLDAGEVDGLFVSNGPGDPAAVGVTIGAVREVLQSSPRAPVFGICLGHQLLAHAVGARTFKLPFGHRGINQPVLEVESGRVVITSQNHGFAVDRESLERAGGEVTHIHLNDGTVAGFRLPGRSVFSVQYHPEASPGPHDAGVLFDRFVEGLHGGVGADRRDARERVVRF